jgi:Adenylate and Guanylate cyclase catalytic domain
MESNGLPGKIHVSEATANELMHHGKPHWVTMRAEKVIAKGKGELQTYWVSVREKTIKNSTTTANISSSGMIFSPDDTRPEGQMPPMSP